MDMVKPQYYVYQLVDPRDGKPFYIGKGQKSRIHAHEREAARGVCSEKCNRINDIHSSGYQIIKDFVCYFWNEKDAYDYERFLIRQIGIFNLTNIALGGGGLRATRRKSLKSRVAQQSPWMDGKSSAQRAFAIVERMAGQFAYWIVVTKCGTERVKMVVEGAAGPKRMYETLGDYALNKGMNDIFHTAMDDKDNHSKISELFKPYNIHFEHKYGS